MGIACKFCGCDMINKDSRSLFCSKSCAAKYQHKFIRLKDPDREKRKVCGCGKNKTPRHGRCAACRNERARKNRLLRIISNSETTRGQSIYSAIRKHSKNIMDFNAVEKVCVLCGYNKYVEICHIQRIADFPKDTPLSEVNNINNLIYLCPNHHKEFDRGLLGPDDELKIKNHNNVDNV